VVILPPTAVQVAALVMVGVAAYSNTLGVPFQFDDLTFIARNPSVRDLHAFMASPQDPGRAFAFLTFALNAAFAAGSLAGYHAVNLAIHLATAMCLYAMAAILVPRMMPADPGLPGISHLAGFMAALFFVAHPIQTQAVTYVYQRLASLVGLLYLATVVSFGFAVTSTRAWVRVALFMQALLLSALALLTKQNAATIPVAIALLDVCFLPGRARERLLRVVPFILLAAGVLGASSVIQASRPAGAVPSVLSLTASTMKFAERGAIAHWASYLATQPRVLITYLRLLLVPVDQNLDYEYPVYSTPLAGPVLLSVAALGVVLGGPAIMAWRARARSGLARVTLFGIGWFLVALSVETVVPLPDVISEHRLYLPSVGLFAILGFGAATVVRRLGPRGRVSALAVLGAWILVLAYGTYARNEVWRDPVLLWADTVHKSPGKARPLAWLGRAHLERGAYDRAMPLLERATALGAAPQVYVDLGATYASLGRDADAERAYRRALESPVLTPGGAFRSLPGVHLKLGALLLASGRIEQACEQFSAEAEGDPTDREAVRNLVACLFARRDVAGGVALAERLVTQDPGDAQSLGNLARGYSWLGDVRRARDAYRRFLSIAGQDMEKERTDAVRWLSEHGE
jgi:hypothetical protein